MKKHHFYARGSLHHFKLFPNPLQDHRSPTRRTFRGTAELDNLGLLPLNSYKLGGHPNIKRGQLIIGVDHFDCQRRLGENTKGLYYENEE